VEKRNSRRGSSILKKERFDDLLADLLEVSMRALKAPIEVAGDLEFLRGQNAEQVAVLQYGMADRALRMLEAYWCAQAARKG
jgi:hypothetical protein